VTDWLDAPGYRIAAEHDALAKAKTLKNVLLLEYRCTNRPESCLLLHVWQTPDGRMFYLPRHQLSTSKNTAETAELARAHRTEDGDRKWPARGGNFDDLLDFTRADPDVGLLLNCRHLRRAIPAAQIDTDCKEATPGRPKRKPITAA